MPRAILRRVVALASAFVLAGLVITTTFSPVRAASPEEIERVSLHFEKVALFLEATGEEAPLSRWERQPIVNVIGGKAHFKELAALLNDLGKLTGLGFMTQKLSKRKATFRIHFMSTAEIRAKTPFKRANCAFGVGRRSTGEIAFADVYISTDTVEKTRHCIYQEVTQALGLRNDSTIVEESIFNDRIVRHSLTETDRILIRTLYDERLRPGMDRRTAMPIALGIIAQHMR
ncbi:MAG: DUF2927 domain-containing protein [Rhodospirillales bacterium]